MRRVASLLAAAILLITPVVLAFFSGGYFVEPRLIAGIVVWAGVIVLCAFGPLPFPRSGPGRLALAGLAGVAVWSAISIAWAPQGGPAKENVERLVLYVGAFVLAVGALRTAPARRVVEPAIAAGATIVVSYGLSERLLPGVIDLTNSGRAHGRLEQPITYWNAEGMLAAVGLVLCGRLAGDRSRPLAVRVLAAAAAAPLGAGLYLSFSRGALAVSVVGLIVLVALLPRRSTLEGAGLALVPALLGGLAAGLLGAVDEVDGPLSPRERDGAILVVALVAAGVSAWRARRAAGEDAALPGGRRLVLVAAGVVVLAVAGLVVGGLREKPSAAALGDAGAGRLVSASSNRYEYWRVGGRAFLDHPLDGLGSAGFRVRWLERRPVPEAVLEVHSIELEMAAELGLVGLLAFAAFVLGVAWAAVRALGRRPELAAGGAAALLAWLLHASIDWDWQLPAVTLPALALAGLVVVLAELPAFAPAAADQISAGSDGNAGSRDGAGRGAVPSTAS
jgi:hypothetical protein